MTQSHIRKEQKSIHTKKKAENDETNNEEKRKRKRKKTKRNSKRRNKRLQGNYTTERYCS
jgi:hypothetical protein